MCFNPSLLLSFLSSFLPFFFPPFLLSFVLSFLPSFIFIILFYSTFHSVYFLELIIPLFLIFIYSNQSNSFFLKGVFLSFFPSSLSPFLFFLSYSPHSLPLTYLPPFLPSFLSSFPLFIFSFLLPSFFPSYLPFFLHHFIFTYSNATDSFHLKCIFLSILAPSSTCRFLHDDEW